MEFHDLNDYASPPILYYDVLSSHARSCQMLIKFLKIDVDLQLTDLMDVVDFNETYTWINSFCRLPTMVDGSVTLCNGHSILIYLCQKFASKNLPNLCPCDYITRQKITSLLYYEGCILNRYLSNLLTDIFLLKYPNIDVEYHKRKVSNAYNSLNAFLNGHPFMVGNRLTIADISIVSTASALNIIFPINYDKFPKLFEWFERLKKMDFYKCNDEGIQKLRYILKNVSKFHFPSTFNNEQDNPELDFEISNFKANESTFATSRNSDAYKSSNKSEFEKPSTSTAKRVENISPTEEKKRVKSLKEEPVFIGNKNHGQKLDSDKFSFYDTYFINVSKCNCCAGSELQESFSEINEIFKRPETVGHLSGVEKNFIKLECQNRQNSSKNIMLPCCCNTESSNPKTHETNSKQDKKTNPINSKRESNAIDSHIVKTDSYDNSSTSNLDDTDDETLKRSQRVKNKIKPQSTDKPRKKDDDKGEETAIAKAVTKKKGTSEVATIFPKTVERESTELANQHVPCTNQEFQDLLEKVRKYEHILENSDKVLRNKNSVPTKTLSDTSSIESITKRQKSDQKLPLKCDAPNCSCEQKYQQCDCHKKQKRKSSKVEALEFDEAVPIVLPKFLVAKSENESENCNLTTPIEAGKRLEAGTILNPFQNQSSLKDSSGLILNLNPKNENSDDTVSQGSEKIAKIIYLLCTKNNGKTKKNCHCVDCCRNGG